MRGWRRSWKLGQYRNSHLDEGSKQMQHTLVRIAIGVPEAFNALSVIGGGIVLLLGTYKDGVLIEAGGRAQFPLEWLQHTPFSDYTIPALILMIGVGGSSLVAAVLVFTGRDEGVLASAMAGLIMAGHRVHHVQIKHT
jgi:lipid-A-disaccharide synthase-like uncharacterized protein